MRFLLSGMILALALSLPSNGQTPAKAPAHSPATLRIGLWTLWHDKEITIAPTSEGAATFRLCDSCAASSLSNSMQIRVSVDRLALPGDKQAAAINFNGTLTITAHGETLTLRNPLHVHARANQLVLAVTLPIETYVERVVVSESGPADTSESLKALAIVVRSFALHQPHGHADYDLCDSTHCQLLHWGGSAGRGPAAHVATLATAGETLFFHGKRAQAWFHQNCGGRTASPREVWSAGVSGRESTAKPMPWLTSHIDTYCTAGGAREWSADLSLAELTTALARAGLAPPGWTSLTVVRRGESGRAVMLAAGSAQISGEDFRLAIGRAFGWSRILSTWFEISRQGDHFLFHGRGSGHGVGLCQAGAAAMSGQGHDPTQILAQYFPGAIIADESTGESWQSLRRQGFALESLGQADSSYLPQLEQAFDDARARSGLQSANPITVRAFPSTAAFRDATLAPGWVAAFTEGNWIATQPLGTLAGRKLLPSVMRHEFLHALIEAQAAPDTPLWFREGLVEALASDSQPTEAPPTLRLDQIDHALAHSATEAQSLAAHRAAAWYAARLLKRHGRLQVLNWLGTALPANAIAELK